MTWRSHSSPATPLRWPLPSLAHWPYEKVARALPKLPTPSDPLLQASIALPLSSVGHHHQYPLPGQLRRPHTKSPPQTGSPTPPTTPPSNIATPWRLERLQGVAPTGFRRSPAQIAWWTGYLRGPQAMDLVMRFPVQNQFQKSLENPRTSQIAPWLFVKF
jgi:hypothetical protein